MKKIKKYIDRKGSILTGKAKLSRLYKFKDFPVFMGCVDEKPQKDIVADMIWNICKDTGVIQLGKLLPLDILYLNNHNDGIGKVWQDHYAAFAKFLSKFSPKYILEIGGAHDHIAKYFSQYDQEVDWTTVEPNPEYIKDPKIRVIKDWFSDKFTYKGKVDTIIHSHVFEHMYDPFDFMRSINKFLKIGDKQIFSFPNMLPMLKNNYTNCLNFEHTVFMPEAIAEYIIKKNGFRVIDKEYYGDPHSIFYATEKVSDPIDTLKLPKNYTLYKKVFMGYIKYHEKMVGNLNKLIKKSDAPVYLFGAHIFSQTLFQFGLNADKIVSVLDNSPIKQGKRLYGTLLNVESPKVLKGKGKINLILKAGIYNDEIKKDILENINSEVVFW